MAKFYEIVPIKYSEVHILFYEAMMLNNIPITHTGNSVEDNIRVESFLLHARNLIDFLEGKGHLKCSQFKDNDNNKIVPIKFSSDDTMRRINEHLSHISTGRKTIKINWKLKLLKNEINEKLKNFLSKISDGYFPSPEGISKESFIISLSST